MKKMLCALLTLSAVLCGCAAPAGGETFPGGTKETATEVSERNGTDFISSVISRPDGINDIEYISSDNGVTWYLEGRETEPPETYLTMLSRSPAPFDPEPMITLHYTGEREMIEIYLGQNSRLEIMRDGKWEELKLTGDMTAAAICFMLYSSAAGNTSLDLRIPLERYGGGSGKYRYTMLCRGNTCRLEFDAELPSGDTSQEKTEDRGQPDDMNSFISSVLSPVDGRAAEYLSYDNGLTWYFDGEQTEPPEAYLTMLGRQPFSADSEPMISLHYTGEKLMTAVYPEKNGKLEIMRDGSWTVLEKRLPDGDIPDIGYEFWLFSTNEGNTSMDKRLPLEMYGGEPGQYRYTMLCSGNTCRIIFDVE